MSTRVAFCNGLSIIAGVCIAAGSCHESTAPVALPSGARAFTPEVVYREWWQQMEACSGLRRSFDAISWFVVAGETPFRIDGIDHPIAGYWDPHGNKIVLLEFLPNQRAPVIRHEMLHALLRRTDHPARYFVDRCGATIGGPDSPD